MSVANFGKPSLKVSKSRKQIVVPSILPKKRTKLAILSNFSTQDCEFRSFFGRIEDTIILFRDLLTFRSIIHTNCAKTNKFSFRFYQLWTRNLRFVFENYLCNKVSIVVVIILPSSSTTTHAWTQNEGLPCRKYMACLNSINIQWRARGGIVESTFYHKYIHTL